jgi:Ca-activated chloride channel family protein
MYDFDLAPRGARLSRLDVVKDVLRRFIHGDGALQGRKNDLIGLAIFARYADSICPLTLDHAAMQEALDQVRTVQPNSAEDGTAIGDGLGLAVERLRELKRTTGSGEQIVITSRAVILLTDGENNAGMLAPEQAGELAATYGIKVYTILAGTGRKMALGGRLPVDDGALRAIAETSGGQFFQARDAESLARIYEAIDQMERTKVEERTHLAWGELSAPWLWAAFACIALQSLLDATWLRKIP